MVEVPGVGGQLPVDGVHDGVLDDVHTARHAGGEDPLRPARKPIGLHQEASGEQPVVRGHLPVHNVLCEDMGAEGHKNTQPCVIRSVFKNSQVHIQLWKQLRDVINNLAQVCKKGIF